MPTTFAPLLTSWEAAGAPLDETWAVVPFLGGGGVDSSDHGSRRATRTEVLRSGPTDFKYVNGVVR